MRNTFLVGLALLIGGCEGGPAASLTSMRSASDQPTAGQLEIKYREQYLTERDPDALQWLLANRIRQGMTVAEIDEVLGETGQREFNDRKLKAGNPAFRANDIAYRWGPDSNGRAIFLMFRDRKLLNYDPKEFADDSSG